RVVAVFALGHQRPATLIARQQAKATAKIPAARALAEVASDGAHVANLRAGDARRSLRQGRVFVHGLARAQLFQRHERPDVDTLRGPADSAQLARPLVLTTRLGRATEFFIKLHRSVPPPRISVSAP